MTKKYFFTVNLLIRSDSNIKKTIDSVIGDEKFFRDHIQINLIDSLGSQLSTSVCADYTEKYPENVYFIDAVGKSPAESYNHALPMSFGSYISYIDNYGTYSPNSFKILMDILKNEKIPVICCKPMYSVPGSAPIPYVDDLEPGIIRIHDIPDRFVLMTGCYFFKNNIARSVTFDKKLDFYYDIKFIIEILLKTHAFVYSDKYSYTLSKPTEREIIRYDQQYSANFYTPAIKQFIIPMLKAYAGSAFVMSVMMYLIGVKFMLNADEKNKCVLTGTNVAEFFNTCAEAFKFIDDTVIMNKRICRLCCLDPEIPFRFLRMKYKNPSLYPQVDLVPPKFQEEYKYYVAENRMEAITMSGEFTAHFKKVLITRSKDISAEITALFCDKTGLHLDAVLNNCSCLPEEEYCVFLSLNGKKSPVSKTNVYSLRKYFGESFLKRYSFRFFIPFGSGQKLDTACLYFKFGKLSFRIPMTFSSIHSKLNDKLKNSYAVFGKRILTYDKKNRSLVLRRATESLLAISETRLKGDINRLAGITDRFIYGRIRRMARSFAAENSQKTVIIFYDENGINSNGNLLFRYFSKNARNNILPFFIAKHDSPEKAFLNDAGYDNIIDYGTAKAKAVILSANYIFASDCDPYDSVGFTEKDKEFLRDLIKAKTISVRDFFLSYKTAQFDNRVRDNVSYIFCASERELINLSAPVYGFSKDMIRVTGNALLDAVTDKKEHLILIAPGERRLFSVYEYSDFYRFSESIFFKAYQYVLSSPKLISACREKNWKIAVLMPQSVQKYSKMFHSDDVVELIPFSEQAEASLVSKASVLVTDYSELQYRFAYKNKAVLYFYPSGLPVNSEHDGENPSANGFGDIIFDKKELCNTLIEGLNDEFPQPEKYRLRAEKFFGINKKSNCRRIYEEFIRILNK